MEDIIKKLYLLFDECVTKKHELNTLIDKNNKLITEVSNKRNELKDKEESLSRRESSIKNSEEIIKMHKDAGEQTIQNGKDFDEINNLRNQINKHGESVRKELDNRRVALDALASELSLRERDLANGLAKLKSDKENMKKDLLNELSKKL